MDNSIKHIRELVKDIDPQVGILDREGALLYNLARKLPPGGCIVEIGSWKGRSTIWLGQGALESGNIVYAIDPHTGTSSHELTGEEDTFEAFISNIKRAGLDKVVRPLRMTSKEACRGKLVKEKINMVFIDGEHQYEDVVIDYYYWGHYLPEDSIVAFHDTIGYIGPRTVVEATIFDVYSSWRLLGICGQIVAARQDYLKWRFSNIPLWVCWKLYSLGFLLLKYLPKSWKEKLK